MSQLLTKREVAETLRVSTRTVGRYVKSGLLRPIRVSEQVVRFYRDDLERFLSEARKAQGRD